MSPISTKRHGDVLIVTSNNPPVNALGADAAWEVDLFGGIGRGIEATRA